MSIKCKKILIGGFYRPPNSRAEYFNFIQESFERACNTNIKDIVILGDFNYNMYNPTNNKMLDLIQQYNFTQIIQESTHFTEHSESFIDLILVSNLNNIVNSDTSDPFIDNQVRFHCPIICVLKFLKPIPKTYKRRIWLYYKVDCCTYLLVCNFSIVATCPSIQLPALLFVCVLFVLFVDVLSGEPKQN